MPRPSRLLKLKQNHLRERKKSPLILKVNLILKYLIIMILSVFNV